MRMDGQVYLLQKHIDRVVATGINKTSQLYVFLNCFLTFVTKCLLRNRFLVDLFLTFLQMWSPQCGPSFYNVIIV